MRRTVFTPFNVAAWRALLVLAMLLITAGSTTAQPELLARDDNGDSVCVRPLDDPANPYCGEYSAWEQYASTFIDPALTEDRLKALPADEEFETQSFFAGPDGYLVPLWRFHEALLAATSEVERRAWLAGFVLTDRRRPAIVPICVFHADLPAGSPRVHRVEAETVAPESFLVRLASR